MFEESTSGRQSSVPLGWLMTVPVPYRPEPLKYFTPHSFSTLLSRVPQSQSPPLSDQVQSQLKASLLTGALHVNNGQASGRHLSVYGELIFGRYQLKSLADLCVLAATLTGHSKLALRQDIAYAGNPGARNPTIFALEDHIHELMDDFLQTLTLADDMRVSPRDAALLVLFFVLSVHPFMDGNGRLSRCLALHAGRIVGDVAEGALVAAVQVSNRGWFFDIGQRARDIGSSVITHDAYRTIGVIDERLQEIGLNLTSVKLAAIVQSELERKQLLLRYVSSCVAKGAIRKAETKQVLGCSENKAKGLAHRLALAIPDSSVQQEETSFKPYLETLKSNMSVK